MNNVNARPITIDTIYTHTLGEPTCVVHGGILFPFATDIMQHRSYLETEYGWLRAALMQEPRGHRDMHGTIITPPTAPGFDAGLIFLSGTSFMHACGHGTIGVSIALIETGMKKRDGKLTELKFETTAGPVTAEVYSVGGEESWCRYRNVPSFVEEESVPISVPHFGDLTADIVYCGSYFGVIDIRDLPLKIEPANSHELVKLGLSARDILNKAVKVQHPERPHINRIETIALCDNPTSPESHFRTTLIFGNGQVDRAPGGAGAAALIALRDLRGEMTVGDRIYTEGILGAGKYESEFIGVTDVAGKRATVATIKSSAHITGRAQWTIDPNDPIGMGFVLG